MYHGVQHVSCHPPSRPDLVDMLPFGIPSVPIFAGHVGDFFGLHHPTSNLESQLFVAHPIFHPMGIFQTKTGWCFFATPWKIWVRQIGSSSQLLGKIKNDPKHQPGKVVGKTMTTPTFSKPREPPCVGSRSRWPPSMTAGSLAKSTSISSSKGATGVSMCFGSSFQICFTISAWDTRDLLSIPAIAAIPDMFIMPGKSQTCIHKARLTHINPPFHLAPPVPSNNFLIYGFITMWLIKLIKLYTAIGAFIRTLVLPGMSFWDRKNFFKPAIRWCSWRVQCVRARQCFKTCCIAAYVKIENQLNNTEGNHNTNKYYIYIQTRHLETHT